MQCDMGFRACMANPAKFPRQTCMPCSMLVKYELGYLLVRLGFSCSIRVYSHHSHLWLVAVLKKLKNHSASSAMIKVQLPSSLLSIAIGHDSVFGNVAQSSRCEIAYMVLSQLAVYSRSESCHSAPRGCSALSH